MPNGPDFSHITRFQSPIDSNKTNEPHKPCQLSFFKIRQLRASYNARSKEYGSFMLQMRSQWSVIYQIVYYWLQFLLHLGEYLPILSIFESFFFFSFLWIHDVGVLLVIWLCLCSCTVCAIALPKDAFIPIFKMGMWKWRALFLELKNDLVPLFEWEFASRWLLLST